MREWGGEMAARRDAPREQRAAPSAHRDAFGSAAAAHTHDGRRKPRDMRRARRHLVVRLEDGQRREPAGGRVLAREAAAAPAGARLDVELERGDAAAAAAALRAVRAARAVAAAAVGEAAAVRGRGELKKSTSARQFV